MTSTVPPPKVDHIIAVDCDLGRMHAWSSEAGRVCYNEPLVNIVASHINALGPELVLFEIASPVMYGEIVSDSKLSWALWNMAMAVRLERLLDMQMVVAPSHVWTLKHKEAVRHRLAQCLATNHDLRECEAMIWFHRHKPGDWINLTQYLHNLTTRSKSYGSRGKTDKRTR